MRVSKNTKDLDWPLTATVVKALGKIGNSRAVNPLIKLLDDSDASWHHPAVAKALGKIGDKRAVKPLLKLLKNKAEYYFRPYSETSVYNDVQQATLKALNRLGHPN